MDAKDSDNFFARYLYKRGGALHTRRTHTTTTTTTTAAAAAAHGDTNDADAPPCKRACNEAASVTSTTTTTTAAVPSCFVHEHKASDGRAAVVVSDCQRVQHGNRHNSNDEDDEDDALDVLLGKAEAQRVKLADAQQQQQQRQQQCRNSGGSVASSTSTTAAATAAAAAATTLSSPCSSTSAVAAAAATTTTTTMCSRVRDMATLPWARHARHEGEATTRLFTQQLLYELYNNAELLHSFRPFLRERVVRQLCAHRHHPRHGNNNNDSDDDDPSNNSDDDDDDDTYTRSRHADAAAATPPTRLFAAAPTVTRALVDVATAGGRVLRDYQLAGVQFLLQRFHAGMSCVLADDMGLGKTAQVASFLHVLQRLYGIAGPHLIITPLSTLTSWTRELARWAPSLHVHTYHGERAARRASRHGHTYHHGVVVTTPAIAQRDAHVVRRRCWVVAVVDEAHVLKGHNTRIASTARKLRACLRVAVTGTPVHNRVDEVWTLMNYLYPDVTTTRRTAAAATVAAEAAVLRAAETCVRVLQHIMLRRTKQSLELGVPPRIDEPVTMLTPTRVQQRLLARLTAHVLQAQPQQQPQQAQQQQHDSNSTTDTQLPTQTATDVVATVTSKSAEARRLQVHLTHQRVICNHPLALRLVACEERASSSGGGGGGGGGDNVSLSWQQTQARLRAAGVPLTVAALVTPSAKMRHLDEVLLPRLRADGHRALIFANFTSTLDLLEGLCRVRGYSYERLDGSSHRVERELAMLRFNAPSSRCFLFLITTTAGGVGVTLTGADTVILYDAHYNPQLDRQAADRAHRLGQTRVVRVLRLCLRDTIEESIRAIAARKASLGDYIVDNGTTTSHASSSSRSGSAPSVADIRAMLQQQQQQQQKLSDSAAVAAADGDDDVACEQTSEAEDDALVEQLVRVEQQGLAYTGNMGSNSRSTDAVSTVVDDDNDEEDDAAAAATSATRTHVDCRTHCFVCGDVMHALEPMYHCVACAKAYHAACIGERVPAPGTRLPARWSCGRHACSVCGKTQRADGALFLCTRCPRSFCFDCLHPRYLELAADGHTLLRVRSEYAAMAADGVLPRRSYYYITCASCDGCASSSSSSSSDEEDDGSDSGGSSSSSSSAADKDDTDDDDDDDLL